jgi:hypothetical protein
MLFLLAASNQKRYRAPAVMKYHTEKRERFNIFLVTPNKLGVQEP